MVGLLQVKSAGGYSLIPPRPRLKTWISTQQDEPPSYGARALVGGRWVPTVGNGRAEEEEVRLVVAWPAPLKDVGGGGGAFRDEANTCRARLAIDGCMLC